MAAVLDASAAPPRKPKRTSSGEGSTFGIGNTSTTFELVDCTRSHSRPYNMTTTKKRSSNVMRTSIGSSTSLAGTRSVFLGREDELELLHDLYQKTMQHSSSLDYDQATRQVVSVRPCQAVLIHGTSGTGKTSLVRQFLSQLKDEPTKSHNKPSGGHGRAGRGVGKGKGTSATPRKKRMILKGKFEESQADPFSALEQAFGDCIYQIRQVLSQEEHDEVCQDILNAVGDEGRAILSGMIPALNTLFVLSDTLEDQMALYNNANQNIISNTCTNNSNNNNNNGANSFSKSKRLQYYFVKFIAALSSNRSLLLVLDDWQWADQASLDLIAYLLTVTADIPNFFLLGTYRPVPTTGDDEAKESAPKIITTSQHHPLATFLHSSQEHVHIIPLQNHCTAEIEALIEHELRCSESQADISSHSSLSDSVDHSSESKQEDDCSSQQSRRENHIRTLTDTIMSKTQGNIFFTKQVLEELKRRGLLLDKHGNSKNSTQLVSAVSLYTNKNRTVIDAVADKIQRLPSEVQRTLSIASHLRSTFDIQTLHRLLLHLEETGDPNSQLSMKELRETLDAAVVEGLIQNAVGSDMYHFSHDKVKEAAYSNIQTAGPGYQDFLVNIGSFLRAEAETSGEDWMLFLASRHYSMATDSIDPLELAELFSQCGMKSMKMTAIEQAAIFFEQGIAALQRMPDPWGDHYQLALSLFHSAAETELAVGHYERGYDLGNEVLGKAHSLTEKLPTYDALDQAMMMQERHSDALVLDLQVLKQLDASPGTVTGLRDILKVKQLVKNHTDEQILSLPPISNEEALAAIRFLSNATVHCYITGKMVLQVSCVMKQIKMAFKFGLCSEVAKSLALYGAILFGFLGDQATGRRVASLAKKMLEQPRFRRFECETLFTCASFIDMWSEPYSTVIDTFERAHQLGTASGNHTYGYGAYVESIWTSFVAGANLQELEQRFLEGSAILRRYKLDLLIRILDALGVVIYPLMGRELRELKDEESVLTQDAHSALGITWKYFAQMVAAYYLGDLEKAERHCKNFNKDTAEVSCILQSLGAFYSGLICAALYRKAPSYSGLIKGTAFYRESRRSKYKSRAQKYTRKLGKTVAAGCSNNKHKLHLMEAECMAAFKLTTSKAETKQMYDRAIAEAAEIGCLQDEALANELAGEYALLCGEGLFAKMYLRNACQLYLEWGAEGKVHRLLRKYSAHVEEGQLRAACPIARPRDEFLSLSITASDDLASDDMSGLTPIYENMIYNTRKKNRWENSGLDEIDAPPTAPMCPARIDSFED